MNFVILKIKFWISLKIIKFDGFDYFIIVQFQKIHMSLSFIYTLSHTH